MDYKDKELVQYYFDQLKKLAQKDHCIFIKFDPAIHVNDYDSKSYNTNRYKETELYLDTFKSCNAIHHGYYDEYCRYSAAKISIKRIFI